MMHATTIQKYQKLSTSKLKLKAQAVFNKWIRQRDQDQYGAFECISCGKRKRIIYYRSDSGRITGTNYHAGHFYPAGHCEALRFHENNCHGQCVQCNLHKHGNAGLYARNLEKRIGREAVQDLHNLYDYYKRALKRWTRFELIDIIERFNEGRENYRKV